MTREEFEKKLNENLKNAVNDYMEKIKEIDEAKIRGRFHFFQYNEEMKNLQSELLDRIRFENNAIVVYCNISTIKGYVEFDDFENIEFEIKLNK